MTLSKHYSISTRHQRSTRIDSDLNSAFFPGLVYHGTAQTALETLFRQYSQTGQRAYTLTGPYGSGKSTVALLLTGLLSHDNELRSTALNVINQDSTKLLKESIEFKKGWLQIRSVGGVNSPVATFWQATLSALKEHPNTINLFNRYQKLTVETDAELIRTWEALFLEANNLIDGVLLLADEMGKSLEFINKNKGELHLFQDIAEVLGRTPTPVIFIGLLHQAFSEYAKDRGTKLQEEWGKIQGRYNDIIYNVSTDETVALIGQSIVNESNLTHQDDIYVKAVLNALNDKKERKTLLKERLEQCAPLHPLSALLLGPISKRRFSQNERSTFSFLNSHEQNSFQLFLQTAIDKDARYDLVNLWDYLEVNLEHAILSSPDGHAWATATESIRQAIQKGLPEIAIGVLKNIALITLFGKPANLTATESLLLASTQVKDKNELDEYLSMLKDKSCIIYRKHLSSWMVFEGSDLDLQGLVESTIEQINDPKEAIDYIQYTDQVIAKGHYHTTGTLRWAEQQIVTSAANIDLQEIENSDSAAFVSFILILQSDPAYDLKDASLQSEKVILAIADNSEDIVTLAKECYALELIKSDKETGRILQHDKVAQKEYEGRRINAEIALSNAISNSFNNSHWFYKGKEYSTESLSHISTLAADHIYNCSPKIKNELVNRNKLSGTAVSALKKLLEAMLEHEDQEYLGITGFPPEKSMYISCLKNTAIHSEIEDGNKHWHVDNLSPALDAVFNAALALIKEQEGETVPLSAIKTLWSQAPYGLTQGLIPIYLFAFVKSIGQDLAFYEKDLSGDFAFITEPDIDYVHKLIKTPQDLAVKFIILKEEEKNWLQYLRGFASSEASRGISTNQDISNSVLAVATPLVTGMHNLPQWVKNAHQFIKDDPKKNKLVISIRDLFLQANDPHSLLFKDLVNLLDPKDMLNNLERIELLEECFKTLKEKHEKTLLGFKNQVQSFFPETGEELASMCNVVINSSGDSNLHNFALDLAKSEQGLINWIESMLQTISGRIKQNWNEEILATAINKVSDYAQSFLSVVKSQSSKGENTSPVKTKLVSLVLEDDDGKLVSYKKEIRLTDSKQLKTTIETLKSDLESLDEFDKINVLQYMLKETLEAQD
ncbi:hypothetical protein [Vibrio algicola]|uniref:ATP-binding protein n=1 Tax=Vibrio algicola TaxID=2662262 RepID=A0A5Q0TE90_9VIBR|nr:hypothetical protein [Vibrio algicola]